MLVFSPSCDILNNDEKAAQAVFEHADELLSLDAAPEGNSAALSRPSSLGVAAILQKN
jgi:hypothetical protein